MFFQYFYGLFLHLELWSIWKFWYGRLTLFSVLSVYCPNSYQSSYFLWENHSEQLSRLYSHAWSARNKICLLGLPLCTGSMVELPLQLILRLAKGSDFQRKPPTFPSRSFPPSAGCEVSKSWRISGKPTSKGEDNVSNSAWFDFTRALQFPSPRSQLSHTPSCNMSEWNEHSVRAEVYLDPGLASVGLRISLSHL